MRIYATSLSFPFNNELRNDDGMVGEAVTEEIFMKKKENVAAINSVARYGESGEKGVKLKSVKYSP